MKLAGAYINDDTYERLAALALENNRTLAGQCRHLFDRALKGDLQVPDCTPGHEPLPRGATRAAGHTARPLAGAAVKTLPLTAATRVAETPATDPTDCGQSGSEMISTHTPTMMKTPTPNTPCRGRCRPDAAPAPGTTPHDNPRPGSPHAERGAAR